MAAAVLVAGISFAGGYEVGQGGVPSSGAAGLGDGGFGRFGNGLGGSGAPGGRFGQGRGTGAGGTAGTISSVAPDQLTVSVASGGSKLVLVDSSTTVTKISSTDEALTDLSQGESITVVGTTNPDGSVTAMQIIVGQADGLFGPPGQRRGPGGSPLPTAGP
ncbi:MAG TPA: DUF5666 domain-containing protein [Candidatus Limnocylindrales bacterium]|nr:DUF5666 domain-containing protein [Candidatus Limnocylindrales bacterium]